MRRPSLFLIAILVALAGYIFIERQYNPSIGNALEKNNLIRLQSPRPGETVRSPLLVQGLARGYWFFEASFPVKVYDASNNLLGTGIAQAQSDWMTEEFVPFQATVEFETPSIKEGTLVLEKDNPSGLPEHADQLRVPIRFEGL